MIIRPSADEGGVEAALARTRELLERQGGADVDEERWGLRRLAYPIQSFREGTYALTRFRMEGDGTGQIDSALRMDDDIIRHLIVRVDE